MTKLPPIEKIPEAYTAIDDDRITLYGDTAEVLSSNGANTYTIKWKDNLYYSNDNSTYWQGYIGYPVIAILMLQGKLSLNKSISKYFKGIDWNKLNKENKRDYHASLEQVLKDIKEEDKIKIYEEINKVFDEIKKLNIELTRNKI